MNPDIVILGFCVLALSGCVIKLWWDLRQLWEWADQADKLLGALADWVESGGGR